jgi:hypothetical protein
MQEQVYLPCRCRSEGIAFLCAAVQLGECAKHHLHGLHIGGLRRVHSKGHPCTAVLPSAVLTQWSYNPHLVAAGRPMVLGSACWDAQCSVTARRFCHAAPVAEDMYICIAVYVHTGQCRLSCDTPALSLHGSGFWQGGGVRCVCLCAGTTTPH